MKDFLFLMTVLVLLVLSAACGDRMDRPIPGGEDSLHYFNSSEYKVIRKLPDSVGFRIRSTRLEGKSKNRLILDVTMSKDVLGYDFPIVYGAQSYSGATIKPRSISMGEEAEPILNKRLKYMIFGLRSGSTRLYLRLPNTDSVLFELPVRWRDSKE
jgi:hypothetical protein